MLANCLLIVVDDLGDRTRRQSPPTRKMTLSFKHPIVRTSNTLLKWPCPQRDGENEREIEREIREKERTREINK